MEKKTLRIKVADTALQGITVIFFLKFRFFPFAGPPTDLGRRTDTRRSRYITIRTRVLYTYTASLLLLHTDIRVIIIIITHKLGVWSVPVLVLLRRGPNSRGHDNITRAAPNARNYCFIRCTRAFVFTVSPVPSQRCAHRCVSFASPVAQRAHRSDLCGRKTLSRTEGVYVII